MINSSIHCFVNSIGGSTVVQDSLNHPKIKGSCLASATKAPGARRANKTKNILSKDRLEFYKITYDRFMIKKIVTI